MRENYQKPHTRWQFESAEDLSSMAKREDMPKGDFADPKNKKFPIPDKQHAQLAMKYIRHAGPKVKERIKKMAAEFGIGPYAKGKVAASDMYGSKSAAGQIGNATFVGKMKNLVSDIKSGKETGMPTTQDDFTSKERKANVPSAKAEGTMHRLGNTEAQRAKAKVMNDPNKQKVDLGSVFGGADEATFAPKAKIPIKDIPDTERIRKCNVQQGKPVC